MWYLRQVAVKTLEKSRLKDATDTKRVNREIKFLKKMHHSNIIQLFEVIETTDSINLVMEYVEG